jgi:hypothetical protein
MTEFIEVLRQEHRNIESLLRVLERELSVFDRGERPDYGGRSRRSSTTSRTIRLAAITRRRT